MYYLLVTSDLTQISADNPHKAEVDNMLHDLPLIEQIAQLVSQLRMKYQVYDLYSFIC